MVGISLLNKPRVEHEKLVVPTFMGVPENSSIAHAQFVTVAPENGDPMLPHAAWRYLVDRAILDEYIQAGAGQRAPVYYKYWGMDISAPSGLEFDERPGAGERMWEYSQFDGLRAGTFGTFVTRSAEIYNQADAEGQTLQELFGHTIFGNGRAKPMLDHLLQAAVELLPRADAAA